jgi:hypothetical protein
MSSNLTPDYDITKDKLLIATTPAQIQLNHNRNLQLSVKDLTKLCEEELYLIVYYVDHAKLETETESLAAGKLKLKVKAELQKRGLVKADDTVAWRTWKFDQRQKANAHKTKVTLHVSNNLARTRSQIRLLSQAKSSDRQEADIDAALDAALRTTPPSSQASSVHTSPLQPGPSFLDAFKLKTKSTEPILEEATSESGYTSDKVQLHGKRSITAGISKLTLQAKKSCLTLEDQQQPTTSISETAPNTPRDFADEDSEDDDRLLGSSFYSFEQKLALKQLAKEQNRPVFALSYYDIEREILVTVAEDLDNEIPSTVYLHFAGLTEQLIVEGIKPGILFRPYTHETNTSFLDCSQAIFVFRGKHRSRTTDPDPERTANTLTIWRKIQSDLRFYRGKFAAATATGASSNPICVDTTACKFTNIPA